MTDPATTIREALAQHTEGYFDQQRDALAALTELEQQLGKFQALYEASVIDQTRLEAAERERDQLAATLRALASWQPSTPRGLDELHPQHIEAIVDARDALDRHTQP
jgi:hypothetical protein